jgi:hypothetical protein
VSTITNISVLYREFTDALTEVLAEKEDAVAGLPHPQQRSVAINDVGCDAKASGLADDIVQPAVCASDEE